jgi:hypothetical protein
MWFLWRKGCCAVGVAKINTGHFIRKAGAVAIFYQFNH